MSLAKWFRDAFGGEERDGHGEQSPACNNPARPRLAAVRIAPTRDEFAAWRNDATTRFVMAALNRNADECRDAWMSASWEGGIADQRKLDGLRERSDALLGFTADYEAFCETLGLEPQPEAADENA